MRIFKGKEFAKWSRKLGLTNSALLKTVDELSNGLFDAKLGSSIYKKRLGFGNKGKRDGIRTILAFKLNKAVIFILGFQKSELDNISEKEENALRNLAKIYLDFSDKQFDIAVKNGELVEVKNEKINT